MLSNEEWKAQQEQKKKSRSKDWEAHEGPYKLVRLAADYRGDAGDIVLEERELSSAEAARMTNRTSSYGSPAWVDLNRRLENKFHANQYFESFPQP